MAEEFGGSCKVVKGDDLLKEGDAYPMVSTLKNRDLPYPGSRAPSRARRTIAVVLMIVNFMAYFLITSRLSLSEMPPLSWSQIHAVGRAAGVGREPRLLDLTWTPPDSDGDLPKVFVGSSTYIPWMAFSCVTFFCLHRCNASYDQAIRIQNLRTRFLFKFLPSGAPDIVL